MEFAMGDLRDLGEAGRAGEEECRCCVFGLVGEVKRVQGPAP
jgi:hypothetical protein